MAAGDGAQLPATVAASRSVEKALEEAASSGALILSNRKLKEFPRTSKNYDLSDITHAGKTLIKRSEGDQWKGGGNVSVHLMSFVWVSSSPAPLLQGCTSTTIITPDPEKADLSLFMICVGSRSSDKFVSVLAFASKELDHCPCSSLLCFGFLSQVVVFETGVFALEIEDICAVLLFLLLRWKLHSGWAILPPPTHFKTSHLIAVQWKPRGIVIQNVIVVVSSFECTLIGRELVEIHLASSTNMTICSSLIHTQSVNKAVFEPTNPHTHMFWSRVVAVHLLFSWD